MCTAIRGSQVCLQLCTPSEKYVTCFYSHKRLESALDGLKFRFEFLNQNVKALWGNVCLCCPSTVGHKSFDLGDVISLFPNYAFYTCISKGA